MPTGQGVLFAGQRETCSRLAVFPGTVARCYVCIALLGDVQAEDHTHRSAWLPHAELWFDVHAPRLAEQLKDRCWSYLLAAMLQVVEKCLEGRDGCNTLLHEIRDCESNARAKILHLLQQRPAARSISSAHARGVPRVLARDPRWDAVAAALRGPPAPRVVALYFLSTLHASLGVAQADPDRAHASPRTFHRRLAQVVRGIWAADCKLCVVGAQVAQGMSGLMVMHESAEDGVPVTPLIAMLPAGFAPAGRDSRPYLRAAVRQWLGSDGSAALLAAHDLAEAVADTLLDPLRNGRAGVAGLGPADCECLWNRLRRPPLTESSERSGPIRPASAHGTTLTRPGQRMGQALRLLSRGVLQAMSSARLAHLAAALRQPWQHAGTDCAVCHVPRTASGRPS